MSTENTNLTSTNDFASIESAVAGNYDFSIGDTLKEGWQRVGGLKGPFWAAALVVFIFVLVAGLALSAIANVLSLTNGTVGLVAQLLLQLAVMAAIYPFMAGIAMLGVRRAVDLPISYQEAFAYFAYISPLVVAGILMSILITLGFLLLIIPGIYAYIFYISPLVIAGVLMRILMTLGFLLLIIPGIYLSVAYMFTVQLVVEKNLSAWQAMETSRKAVTHHWFKFFFTILIMGIIFLLSAIPLGLGLIWTYPMLVAVMGILYRDTFGVQQAE
tara:strand:- start:14007 stop:14822 length:816 start_codon:yes stop_codon:yes gene_type:complete